MLMTVVSNAADFIRVSLDCIRSATFFTTRLRLGISNRGQSLWFIVYVSSRVSLLVAQSSDTLSLCLATIRSISSQECEWHSRQRQGCSGSTTYGWFLT